MQFLIDIALSLLYFGAFLILCAWMWRFWMMYVNQRYLNKTNEEYLMLEIKLPREIFKSPFATEVALSSLLQGGGVGSWYHRLFLGNLPVYSSLEIASIEGIIHFYVRVQEKFRSLVESNFYAQYPGIEIVEAEDYTKLIRYTHLSTDVNCWGATYKLGRDWKPIDPKKGVPYDKDEYKMPADFFPIKTYTDYELEKNPKEEFKVDPITTLLEYMGSVGKGEHLWFQILVQDEGSYNGKKFPYFYESKAFHERMSLATMANKYKETIVRSAGMKLKGTPAKDAYGYAMTKKKDDGTTFEVTYQEDMAIPVKENELTVEKKWEIDMINKKFGKPLAMGVVRLLYVCRKENWNAQNIQKIVTYQKPYIGPNFLSLTTTDPYNFPWQNTNGRRVPWRTEEMFDAYVEREGFYPHVPERKGLDSFEDRMFWPYSMKTRKIWRMLFEGFFHPFTHPHPADVSTYNLEELATMWHLPGAVATTPTLPRIDSAKGVAPVNLPH
jgi:hypothetical protein